MSELCAAHFNCACSTTIYSLTILNTLYNMAPLSRLNPRRPIPKNSLNGCEADTPKRKTRFLNALAKAGLSANLCAIAQGYEVSESVGRKWKKQWLKGYGILATRSTQTRSKVLGRKSTVAKASCKFLVSTDNVIQKKPLDTQIVGTSQLHIMEVDH